MTAAVVDRYQSGLDAILWSRTERPFVRLAC